MPQKFPRLAIFCSLKAFKSAIFDARSPVFRMGMLISVLLFASGCAYYNTLFNAKKSFNQGIKVIRESPDQEKTPPTAKKHFETTVDKCWKLIEIYSDNSKYADDALMYIAKSEFYLEKYPQAKQHLAQFMKKYPNSNLLSEAQLWYAKVLLKEEDLEGAQEYFLLVINTAKESQLRSQANFELGLYAFEKEDYPKSIEYLRSALKEKIDDEYKALLLYYLGESYFIQKNYKEAIEQYKKVADFSPALDIEYKSLLHLAKAYTETGKYKESERILRKMLTAPRFQNFTPVIKAALGENHQRQGRLEDAIEIYKEVVLERKTSPGSAEAAFQLGKIYEHTYNDIDSAVTYYGKVEQLFSKFDSVEVAKNKKIFLSEFKGIRDKIRTDENLVYRLTHDPAFRDSLFRAQEEDSLRRARGLPEEESLPATQFPGSSSTLADSLNQARQDSLAQALQDSLNQTLPDSVRQRLEEENLFRGFRDPEEGLPDPENPFPATSPGANPPKPAEQKKPLEKRKLPRIEFDLMNSRFQLAEFYLLKEQNYDSAAYHYHKFLDTYEDSLLSPKALYSLIYIYKQPGHEDPVQLYELEKEILSRHTDSAFALEIMKNKGMLVEEKTEITVEDKANQLFLEGETEYFKGNFNRAIEKYQQAANLDTTLAISAKAQYAIAWVYEHDLKQPESALKAYKTLIERYPSAADYVRAARKKTTPVAPSPGSTSADSTLLATAPGEPLPGEEPSSILAGVEGNGKIVLEDILNEKIRWRIRRERYLDR